MITAVLDGIGAQRIRNEQIGLDQIVTERNRTQIGTDCSKIKLERNGLDEIGTTQIGSQRNSLEMFVRNETNQFGLPRNKTDRFGTERNGSDRNGADREGEKKRRERSITSSSNTLTTSP